MREIYYIGGSTCCGKSSMATIIAGRHNLRRFSLDDHLDKYMSRLAGRGNELCKKTLELDMEGMWMRDPQLLCEEEIALYRDMFPLALRDIAKLPGKGPILAEGAGFLPGMIHEAGVDAVHYFCVTPTRDFQWKHYSGRSWIKEYLTGCSNQTLAFDNWMERDALFAQHVLLEARDHGYEAMIVDGHETIEEGAAVIERQFGLKGLENNNATASN